MFEFNLTNYFEVVSLVCSIVLLAGLYQIGSLIFKIEEINKIISQISDIKYQKVFISTNLLLLIFYPIILFSNKVNLIPILSIVIFCFGLIKIIFKFKKKFNFQKIILNQNHIDKYLVFFILLCLFFLSLSPNTHGDSLGYHFVVAKKLLSSGNYPSDITHFHSLLSGSGEIIIAIGLYFGSEQFGSLIQFSGLLSIFGVFKKIKIKQKYFFFLLVLTSPIILFLSSTSKPQLFHICSTAIVFSLYFFENNIILSSKEKKWKIIISILILIVSVGAKFNFILSSFLIGIFIMYEAIKDKKISFFILSFIFSFFLFYFPIILWKFLSFGGSLFQYIYSPLPLNIIGFEEFKQYLVRYGRAQNPIEIFFSTKIQSFTNSVGIAFFYLFLINFRKNINAVLAIMLIFLYLLVQYIYGQFIGRSFLEPLFWILLICARYGVTYRFIIFEFMCRAQAIFFIVGAIYGIYSLFPGSLTNSFKDSVLSQNANGYSLFKWANTRLKSEDVAFSLHRSISLGKSEFLSTDFIPYVDFTDEESKILVKAINKKDPDYILTWSFINKEPLLYELKNCAGKLVHFKKDVGKFEARNPFNRGGRIDGYIFEFKKTEFPDCIKK